jgi:type IV pilus assembly protein PilV
MKRPQELHRRQRGIVMLDALIAIVIFSIGIVGMVKLQSAAVDIASSVKDRTDAAMLADQVIAQMWTSDKTTAGALQQNFQSPGGAAYTTWVSSVNRELPGTTATPPTITVDANNYVTVTVYWQAPSDASAHKYVSSTQIQP